MEDRGAALQAQLAWTSVAEADAASRPSSAGSQVSSDGRRIAAGEVLGTTPSQPDGDAMAGRLRGWGGLGGSREGNRTGTEPRKERLPPVPTSGDVSSSGAAQCDAQPTSSGCRWGRLAAMTGVAGVAPGGGVVGEAGLVQKKQTIASIALAARINAGSEFNAKVEERLKARLAAPLTPAQLATQAKRKKMQELRWRHPQVTTTIRPSTTALVLALALGATRVCHPRFL